MSKKTKQAVKKSALTGKLQLLGIRLIESTSKLGELRQDELPGAATQAVTATLMYNKEEKATFVNIRIKLDASYDGDKTKDPAVSIFANFVAQYAIVEDFSDEEVFKKFTNQVGLSNIWPYWREFAQSMTTRMGLPAFPVPLLNVNDLPQDGDKSKD